MKHNEIELEDWKDFASRFPLYEQLRNKTIGITGATGLLGSCMVHCLEELDRQHGLNLTIVCFVRNAERRSRYWVTLRKMPIQKKLWARTS